MFSRILMVCVGNICRSPMAEAVMRHELSTKVPGVIVESAGVNALVGKPADPFGIKLMHERGISLEDHRARQFTAELARGFELILVMEQGHVKAVEQIAPASRGRVFRLGKWGNFEIPDPYRRPRGDFEQALALIDRGVHDVRKLMGHGG